MMVHFLIKTGKAKSKNYQEDHSEGEKESPSFLNQSNDKDKLSAKNFKSIEKTPASFSSFNPSKNQQPTSIPINYKSTFNEPNQGSHQNINSSNNQFVTLQSNNNNPYKNENDESSFMDLANRVISEEDAKKAPKLIIREIDGGIFSNQTLKINAMGLENGLRKTKDGIVFFGPVLTKVNCK
jgi:hypothetical protein